MFRKIEIRFAQKRSVKLEDNKLVFLSIRQGTPFAFKPVRHARCQQKHIARLKVPDGIAHIKASGARPNEYQLMRIVHMVGYIAIRPLQVLHCEGLRRSDRYGASYGNHFLQNQLGSIFTRRLRKSTLLAGSCPCNANVPLEIVCPVWGLIVVSGSLYSRMSFPSINI